MLGRLPKGCRQPLFLSCRCWRRAHCRHQGRRLCLGEPPWQTGNAAAAAPGRVAASRGAALSSARMPARTSRSASDSAAATGGTLHSSSASSRERASREAVRRDIPAARARACCLSDEEPRGGTGPRRRCPARTSTTLPAWLYLPRLEPGYLHFSSSATTACATGTVANLKPWEVARC